MLHQIRSALALLAALSACSTAGPEDPSSTTTRAGSEESEEDGSGSEVTTTDGTTGEECQDDLDGCTGAGDHWRQECLDAAAEDAEPESCEVAHAASSCESVHAYDEATCLSEHQECEPEADHLEEMESLVCKAVAYTDAGACFELCAGPGAAFDECRAVMTEALQACG